MVEMRQILLRQVFARSCTDTGSVVLIGVVCGGELQRRYKQWLWGGRVGFLLACLQVVGAAYLTHVIVEKEYANIHHSRLSNSFS